MRTIGMIDLPVETQTEDHHEQSDTRSPVAPPRSPDRVPAAALTAQS
ncbi:hypothetical protein [Novosphingobium sp. BW1]|nr:hypothetical protein [Novosphingobium sp. BW1]